MKYLKLNPEAQMPIIGLGTWKSKSGETYQAVRWAIKLGYKHIDCASAYGNEAEVGQAISDAIKEGDIKREDLFVTSKLWNDSHLPADVIPALEKSLRDLQLEYLDLYLIHWPVASKKDSEEPVSLSEIPLEMTWNEMIKAKKQGLTRAIGVSNFGIKNLELLKKNTEEIPSVVQVECHPYLCQEKLLEYCKNNMIVMTAYSPLGSKDRPQTLQHQQEPELLTNPTIIAIAEKNKSTPAQILLAFHIQRGVAVIPKSVHHERLSENISSLNVELDSEDMQKIANLNQDYRFIDGKSFEKGQYQAETIFA